jgi:hypothetical protein
MLNECDITTPGSQFQGMHDSAVMAEFGDSYADVPISAEVSREAVMPVDRDMQAARTEYDIMRMQF